MSPDGETITLSNGAEIWYRKQGSGSPLLHIHGSAYGHANFAKLTPIAASQFEVIDFDLPGYGLSRGGPVHENIEDVAHDIAEVISSLGYKRLHVHGTSYGAMLGLVLAATHPEVIDRLVLSSFMARYDLAARMMRTCWKRTARDSGMAAVADLSCVAGFARSFYEREEADALFASMRVAFARNTPEAFIASTEAIERTDLTPHVQHVIAPTLLLAGSEDHMTPFSPAASGVGMAQIAPMLSSVVVKVIPDCGHYVVFEQAEMAGEIIADFLKS
jgi:3-oxoadipate enol-lactonase